MNRFKEWAFYQRPVTIIAPSGSEALQPDVRVVDGLVSIYARESKRKNFPRLMCVGIVGQALNMGLGLQMEDGWFDTDRPSPSRRLRQHEPHTWLKDQNGIYYELTGEQFNPGLDMKFSPGVTIIYPGTDLYQRYRTRQQMAQQTV